MCKAAIECLHGNMCQKLMDLLDLMNSRAGLFAHSDIGFTQQEVLGL